MSEPLSDEERMDGVRRFTKALMADMAETDRPVIDPNNPRAGIIATYGLLYSVRNDGPAVLATIDAQQAELARLKAVEVTP